MGPRKQLIWVLVSQSIGVRGKPLRLILLIIFLGIFQLSAMSQTAVPAAINEVYLAKDNGTGKAGEPATAFLPSDVPIYCVVQLESAVPATVKMNLVAENVPGVKTDTKIVSTSYTTKDGENRVSFNGRPAGMWVPGKYRADIFVDGKLEKNLSFEIKAGVKTVASTSSFRSQQGKAAKPAPPPPRKKSNAPFTAVIVDR